MSQNNEANELINIIDNRINKILKEQDIAFRYVGIVWTTLDYDGTHEDFDLAYAGSIGSLVGVKLLGYTDASDPVFYMRNRSSTILSIGDTVFIDAIGNSMNNAVITQLYLPASKNNVDIRCIGYLQDWESQSTVASNRTLGMIKGVGKGARGDTTVALFIPEDTDTLYREERIKDTDGDYWYCREWHSGLIEAWTIKQRTGNFTGQWGNMFYHKDQLTYPANLFPSGSSVVFNCTAGGTESKGILVATQSDGNSSQTPGLILLRPSGIQGLTYYLRCHCIATPNTFPQVVLDSNGINLSSQVNAVSFNSDVQIAQEPILFDNEDTGETDVKDDVEEFITEDTIENSAENTTAEDNTEDIIEDIQDNNNNNINNTIIDKEEDK